MRCLGLPVCRKPCHCHIPYLLPRLPLAANPSVLHQGTSEKSCNHMPADSSCLSVFTRLSKDQQKIEATFSEVPFLYKPFAKQVVALRTGRALEHQINIEKRAWHILANRAFVTGCPKNDVALQGRIPRLPSRGVGKRREAWHWLPGPRRCPLQPPAQRATRPSSDFDEGKATPTPAGGPGGCLMV